MNKIGATNNFPNGKINEHDEGELAIGLTADTEKGVLIIAFGKPITWIGMTADEADGLAEQLQEKALELRKAQSF